MKCLIQRIAHKLKSKRESLGLTKVEAEKRFNLGRNFVRDAENGKETANIGKVLQYADGLNLEVVVRDESNPLNMLEEAIAVAYKTDRSLASRLISSLTECEKAQIQLREVQIRRKENIKRLTLSI